jgi:hypothetical protein
MASTARRTPAAARSRAVCPGSAALARAGSKIAEESRDGRLPPPIILISEPGLANLVVVEGHKRVTGLLLCPQ